MKNWKNWKELVFYRKNKNKEKLKIFVQNLFKIYQLKLYDKKYRYKNFEDTNSNPEINAANNYCQASFNVDVALQKYIHSHLLKNEKNNVEWTKKLERSLSRIKTYGKYFFIMFLSHYISIKSKKHFIEYLWYGTFDDDLIEAIQKTQNKEEWISMVNKTEKDDEKVAKRFDKKWKDCQTLTTGGNLAKNDPFISKIIDYIKEDK